MTNMLPQEIGTATKQENTTSSTYQRNTIVNIRHTSKQKDIVSKTIKTIK
jgi:hypothetical protein